MSSQQQDNVTPSDIPQTSEPRQSSLLRSSMIMAAGTLLSRILGFIRAAMLVAAIGSIGGGVMAAFQTANTLPNMVFNILAAGVLDAVLVPQIVRALKKPDGNVFVNRLLTAAGLVLFILTVVAMVAAPLLVMMTAASYSNEIRALSIAFALVCLPQIFFYGVYNLLGEVLNARGIFGPYTWAPVVNNIVGIAGLGIFLHMWGTHTILPIGDFTSPQFWVLAGSATLGVVSQALILVIPLRRSGLKIRPDFHFRGTSFGSIPRVAGWTFGILAVSQVGIFSTSNLVAMADAWANEHQPNLGALTDASQIVVGNAAYATAFMIFMVPQSLIAISLATALFTRLADGAVRQDHQAVAHQFHIGVRSISTLNLLAAAILTAGAVPMMHLVLPTTPAPIVEAYAWVLMALMPGVASIGLILMSQRVFFAYEDAKPAFMTGIVPNILQVLVGWSLFFILSPVWWVVGAALAETTCRISQGFISLRAARKANSFIRSDDMIASFLRAVVAAIGSCIVGFGVMWAIGWHPGVESTLGRLLMSMLHLSLVSLVVIPIFWLILRKVSPAETHEVASMIVSRFPVPTPVRYFLLGAESTAASAASRTTLDSQACASPLTTEESMSDDRFEATPDAGTARSGDLSRDAGQPFLPEDPAASSALSLPSTSVPAQPTAPATSIPPLQVSGQVSGQVPTQPSPLTPPPLPPRLSATRISTKVKIAQRKQGGAAPSSTPAHTAHTHATRATLIFFLVFTLIAGIWAVRTATSPVDWNAPSIQIDSLQSVQGAQSGQSESTSESDNAAASAAPVITSAQVISWRDDQGDNENHAIHMIDGNPETEWHSRQFDGPFGDATGIAIIVKLEKPTLLSEVNLRMHDSTSGGELFLQRFNAENPRGGEVLAKTAMSANTVLKPGTPVEVDAFVLRFGAVPQSVDGGLWAWIYELTAK